MAVARQERLEAERARGMTRPDECDVSDPLRYQLHPPQEEGPQEDLAELAVGLHEGEHVVARDLEHGARLPRAHTDDPAAPREHGDLAGELPRSQDGHERLR